MARVEGDPATARLVVSRHEAPQYTGVEVLSLPYAGVISFKLVAAGPSNFLALHLRRDDVNTLKLIDLSENPADGQREPFEWQTVESVHDVTVAAGGSGAFAWVWSGGDGGRRNLHVLFQDAGGQVRAYFEQESAHTTDFRPVAAFDGHTAHVLYLRDTGLFTELAYISCNPADGFAGRHLSLGRTSVDIAEPAVIALEDRAVILLPQLERTAGRRQRGLVRAGILDAGGVWLLEPAAVIYSPGPIAALSAQRTDAGVEFVWLAESDGRLSINGASFDLALESQSLGALVIGARNRFLSELHANQNVRYLVFAEYGGGRMTLWLVDNLTPARAPLSFWLGLDVDAPLGDLLFRSVTLLGSSLGLAALAGFSIVLAVGAALLLRSLLGNDSASGLEFSSLIVVFAFLLLLKRYGGILYFGSVYAPGPAGILIVVGSSAFALYAAKLVGDDLQPLLRYSLAGFLFVAVDYFATLFVRGMPL